MKRDVQYCPLNLFCSISDWMFYFRRYKNVKGYVLRLFGFQFNVRERDTLNKLLNKAKEENSLSPEQLDLLESWKIIKNEK